MQRETGAEHRGRRRATAPRARRAAPPDRGAATRSDCAAARRRRRAGSPCSAGRCRPRGSPAPGSSRRPDGRGRAAREAEHVRAREHGRRRRALQEAASCESHVARPPLLQCTWNSGSESSSANSPRSFISYQLSLPNVAAAQVVDQALARRRARPRARAARARRPPATPAWRPRARPGGSVKPSLLRAAARDRLRQLHAPEVAARRQPGGPVLPAFDAGRVEQIHAHALQRGARQLAPVGLHAEREQRLEREVDGRLGGGGARGLAVEGVVREQGAQQLAHHVAARPRRPAPAPAPAPRRPRASRTRPRACAPGSARASGAPACRGARTARRARSSRAGTACRPRSRRRARRFAGRDGPRTAACETHRSGRAPGRRRASWLLS